MAGTMYYLMGMLSVQECDILDCFATQFELLPSENESEACERFLSEIKLHLNINLQQIFVSQVFRVNNKNYIFDN